MSDNGNNANAFFFQRTAETWGISQFRCGENGKGFSKASIEAEKNEIHVTTNSSTLALQEYSILLPRPSMAQQDLGSPFAASLTKVSGVSFSRHLYRL
jgi:GDP-D-mannose dehydratase